jgi:FkbM family methyltransferase
LKNSVGRKVITARRVLRARGAQGIFVVLGQKISPVFRFLRPQNLRGEFEDWRQRPHWWAGVIVVMRGDLVDLESCTFRVSHPAITTAMKSPFLLGGYEKAERDILKKYLNPEIGVIELGGSVGVIACVTNKMLRIPKKHVVVEANPDLIGLLHDNRDRNGCVFSILNRAIAYGSDEIPFYQDASCFLASSVHVKTARPVTVPTTNLRQIVKEYAFDTCTLICDIEGGEMDLVRHESDVLKEHVEMLIVEVHGWLVGQNLAREMNDALERIGFRCLCEKGATRVFRNLGLAARLRAVREREPGLHGAGET